MSKWTKDTVFNPKMPTAFKMQHNEDRIPSDELDVDIHCDFGQHVTEHENLVSLANNEFGEKCWNHSVTRQTIDFVDCTDGKFSVGVAAFVKVELKDGVHHEEMGYGDVHGVSSKSLAISSARKGAALNAFKKAIQSFGGTALNGIRSQTSPILGKSSSAHNKTESSVKRSKPSPEAGDIPNMILPLEGSNKRGKTPQVSDKVTSLAYDALALGENTNEINDEEERKLERKRRQRQKQEEFRQFFKERQPQSANSSRLVLNAQNKDPSEWIKVDEIIQALDVEETAFISTQELDNMVQTASVHSKANAPQHRIPLLSSPPKRNAAHGWRVPNNASARRLEMN